MPAGGANPGLLGEGKSELADGIAAEHFHFP